MNNFDNLSPELYLNEYYKTLGEENKKLLSFFHQSYSSIPKSQTMLEFGGGPAIWPLISARKKVDTIIFSEYNEPCRKEVIRFLKAEASFDWDDYFRYVSSLEGGNDDTASVETMKAEICNKVVAVIPGDIRKENPLSPNWLSQIDVLSVNSVADAVAETEVEFVSYMTNLLSLLKRGGYYLGFFARRMKGWEHGTEYYSNFPVDEEYMKKLFPKLGLKLLVMESVTSPDYQQDYQGIFMALAQKGNGGRHGKR